LFGWFLVVPEAPRDLRVTDVTYDGISLAWNAPESDGGAPVKRYLIVIREVTKKKFKKVATIDGSSLSCKITTGIEENHDYLLRVYAENEVSELMERNRQTEADKWTNKKAATE